MKNCTGDFNRIVMIVMPT